jgi:hypothetical protein
MEILQSSVTSLSTRFPEVSHHVKTGNVYKMSIAQLVVCIPLLIHGFIYASSQIMLVFQDTLPLLKKLLRLNKCLSLFLFTFLN